MNPMRRSMVSASLTCFVFAWAVLWPDVARADAAPPAAAATADPTMDSARHHFEAGRAAYQANDFQTAIREFKAAEALKPSAILSYNIGLANEKLGRRRVAVRYFRRYLESAPQAPNRAEVEGKISTLEHDIAGQPQSGAAAPEPSSDDPPPPPVPPAMDPNAPPQGEFVPAPDPYAAQAPIMTAPARKRRKNWWVGLVVGLSVAVVVTAIIVAVVVVETRHHHDDDEFSGKVKPPLERSNLLDPHALPSTAHGAETAPLLQVHF
jgi:tetratricopeptide (TPR) repeat protein